MMKRILLSSVIAMSAMTLFAQGAMDAYQFNQPDMKGTARFMSMGGAFGALGGDMTTISQNPGGIGVYRNSEIGFTVNFDIQNSTTESQILKTNDNQFKFLLNNVGYIGSIRLNNSVMPFFNWGFTYNKAASFNRRYSGGMNMKNSMSNYMAGIANSNNLTVGDVSTTDHYDPYNPNDGGFISPWIAILGYDSYLINPQGRNGKTNWSGLWGDKTTGVGNFGVVESGGIDEYNISFGGNILDFLYWGMDFGITSLRFDQQVLWNEKLEDAQIANNDGTIVTTDANWTMTNNYFVRGNGFNYKLGFIVKPIQELRLGFAFHTPTWYAMEEEYKAFTIYDYPNTDIRPGGAETNNGYYGYNDYKFSTPWRLIASAAGVIGSKFIISADYEWTSYQGMNFSAYKEWGVFNNAFYYENKDIDDYYQSTNTFRIGAEYRVLPQVSLRAGYANVSSPIKQEVRDNEYTIYTAGTNPSYSMDNSINYVTCGLGFKYKKFYCDLAYVYKHRSSDWHAFTPDPYSPELPSPQSKLTSDDHQIAVSMGIKF